MNREIKFRAWDKKRNKWITNFQVSHDGLIRFLLPVAESPDRLEWQAINGNDVELCQFTGLTDKKNKEIYEGDIVRSEWNNAEREIESVTEVDWLLSDGFLAGMGDENGKLGAAEVIGNIYENPELL